MVNKIKPRFKKKLKMVQKGDKNYRGKWQEWKINKYIKGSPDHSKWPEMIILGDIRLIYSIESESSPRPGYSWWSSELKLRSKQVEWGQPWSWLPLKYMCDDLISRELLIDPHHHHNEEICYNIITDNAYGIGLSIY